MTAVPAGYVDELVELALTFCSDDERRRCRALVDLRHEILSAAGASAEAAVCEARIAWWASELQRMPAGRAAHPVATAVAEAMAVTESTVESLQEWCVEAGARLRGEQPDSPELFAISAFRRHGVLYSVMEETATDGGHPTGAAIDAACGAGHACAALEAIADRTDGVQAAWLVEPPHEDSVSGSTLAVRLAAEASVAARSTGAQARLTMLVSALAGGALRRLADGRNAPGRFALLWRAWRAGLADGRRRE